MRAAIVAAGLVLSVGGAASAQSVKSEIAAENGVTVTLYADAFAERYEYSAPSIDVTDGFALVARTDQGSTKGSVKIVGSMVYSGEWRYYTAAVFRGGDPADFAERGRNVGRCSSSRYGRSSCTLTEGYAIAVTPEQISKHARDGVLDIQIRSSRAEDPVMLSVPISYFEAVSQVADARAGR